MSFVPQQALVKMFGAATINRPIRLALFSSLLALGSLLAACGGGYSSETPTPGDQNDSGSTSSGSTTSNETSVSDSSSFAAGHEIYEAQCASCHGNSELVTAQSNTSSAPALTELQTRSTLEDKIAAHDTDELASVCIGECARVVSDFIFTAFIEPIHLPNEGETYYQQQCSGCHGDSGITGNASTDLTDSHCETCNDLETLTQVIHQTMPLADASSCTDHCARETAKYILAGFTEVLLPETNNDPQNLPPTAVLTSDYILGPAPLLVSFNASNSFDPEEGALTYHWDFGDGNQASSISPNHVFNEGTYTVELTVTDEEGLTDSTDAQLVILANQSGNEPPVADASASTPVNPNVGTAVQFDASLSSDDGSIANYQWDLGDGTHRTGLSFSHTYASAGSYIVQLIVTDNEGSQASTSITITVVQPNRRPSAVINNPVIAGYAPLVISLDGTDSSDPDGDTLTYQWSSSGNSSDSSSWALNLTAPGTHQIRLTVTDPDGARDITEQFVTVTERAECQTTADFYTENAWPLMNNYVDNRGRNRACTGCHKIGGAYPFEDFVLVEDDAAASFEVVRRYVANGNGQSLIERPMGLPSHSGGSIHPENSFGNLHLVNLVDRLKNPVSCDPDYNDPDPDPDPEPDPVTFWDEVETMSAEDTLRKATLLFAGRSPTTTELDGLTEANLAQRIRNSMQGQNFELFIKESTNDRIWTEKFAQQYSSRALRNITDEWGYDFSTIANEDRVPMNQQIAAQPLQRMVHIINNERPYSEFLTGDYILVTPYIAPLFSYAESPSFNDESDLNEWAEAKLLTPTRYNNNEEITGPSVPYPHAGVFSEPVWLARFPTTDTNRNRHRARYAMIQFLGFDIETLVTRSTDPDALMDTDNPTYKNPNCTGCHTIMDPVAATFMNFNEIGEYRDKVFRTHPMTTLPNSYLRGRLYETGDLWYRHDFEINGERFQGLDDIGFNGESLPALESTAQTDDPNHKNALGWLADAFIADSRFALAAVKFWYPAVFSQAALDQPTDTESVDYHWKSAAFNAQQEVFVQWAESFKTDNGHGEMNVKDLLVAMATSDWFRAESVAESRESETLSQLYTLGLGRLLTPEQLHRKIIDLTGFSWGDYNMRNQYLINYGAYRLPYGGQDSDQNVQRLRNIDSLMAAMTTRMSLEVGCGATLLDFGRDQSNRLLFPSVESTDEPDNSSGTEAIRTNIQWLYAKLLNETVALDSEAVDLVYDLFNAVHADGKGTGNTARCIMYHSSIVPSQSDPNYTIRSWSAVMAFFLGDFEFLYE